MKPKDLNPFIYNTAKDYAMDYQTVERYYNRYPDSSEFYEKLEEFIQERASFGYGKLIKC